MFKPAFSDLECQLNQLEQDLLTKYSMFENITGLTIKAMLQLHVGLNLDLIVHKYPD